MSDNRIRAFLVETKAEPDRWDNKPTYRVTLHLVTCTPDGKSVKNPSDGRDDYGDSLTGPHPLTTSQLADFRATAYASAEYLRWGLHQWTAEYKLSSLELERGERIVKVLRRVKAHLDKAEQEEGSPATFAQYSARVARAVGVSAFLWEVPGERGPGNWGYDAGTYRAHKIGAAVDRLDREYRTWDAEQRRAGYGAEQVS